MRPINDILMKDLLVSAPPQPPYQQLFLPILPFEVPYSNNDVHSLPLSLKTPLYVFSLVVSSPAQ